MASPRPDLTITLVRHGHPAHPFPLHPITLREFHAWLAAYNRAGLAADSHPPPDLLDRARAVPCVVCSDLPRALESARRIAPHLTAQASSLFREAGRPLPTWNVDRSAHLAAWDRLSVRAWHLDRIETDEPHARATTRAREAARELITLAGEFGHVLCVAHGTFNALLATELLNENWRGAATPADEYWGATPYVR